MCNMQLSIGEQCTGEKALLPSPQPSQLPTESELISYVAITLSQIILILCRKRLPPSILAFITHCPFPNAQPFTAPLLSSQEAVLKNVQLQGSAVCSMVMQQCTAPIFTQVWGEGFDRFYRSPCEFL